MNPQILNMHSISMLVFTCIALFLYTHQKYSMEAVSLLILISLVLFFFVFPYGSAPDIFEPISILSGFGHEALITICSLIILGKGLEVTGALQPVGFKLSKIWLKHPKSANLLTIIACAVLSAFLNNTPIIVMILPLIIGVAVRIKIVPSSILMPIGFAAIIGGMATTIGTSTNLLVVSVAEDLGVAEFNMFDFSLPVIIVGIFGILYLWLIAPKLLPERSPPLTGREPRVFWAVLHINEISKACGLTFSECLKLTATEMKVDKIERGNGLFIVKLPSAVIQSGDRFILRDSPEKLKLFEKQLGATLTSDIFQANKTLNSPNIKAEFLAEIVVTRTSEFHGSVLNQIEFIERTGLLPLAVHRPSLSPSEDVEIMENIQNLKLAAGDVLLVQGTEDNLNKFKNSGLALTLDGTTDIPVSHRAPRAVIIMLSTILLAGSGLMPIVYAALLGVGLMLATNVLSWKHIGQSLDRQVILIVVASLALGTALTETNATNLISQAFLSLTSGLPVPIILSGFVLLITILTNLVSNNTIGVIGAPIAIQVALDLGVNPEPFVLAVLFGANMCFLTPFGYQTNLLILSAGGYKFSDFFKVGLPLTLIMWIGLSLSLIMIYNL
jgi:di/tricarboxylate transporter